MSDEKVLTKEIAEQFLADEESVNLEEFTSIEDDAAESLSKFEGELALDNLNGISVSSATWLANSSGELFLDSLTELDVDTALALNSFAGDCLTLNGIIQIDDEVISALSQCTSQLHMREWEMPTPLTSDAAILLLKLDEHDRPAMDSIQEIDPDAATVLAKNCQNLELPNLTSLSEAVAVRLAKIAGDLSLDGISNIPKTVADQLAKHRGRLYLNEGDVDGISRLNPGEFPDVSELHVHVKIYNWLAYCDDFYWSPEKFFDTAENPRQKLSVEQAKVIASGYPANMPLWLDPWFETPDSEVLKELARCKCLCFRICWPEITQSQAEILATFAATSINLYTYPILAEEKQRCLMHLDAAKALVSFRGELNSTGPIAEPDSDVFAHLSSERIEFGEGGVKSEKIYYHCGLCGTKHYVDENQQLEESGDDFDARAERESELTSNGWTKHGIAGWICDDCDCSWITPDED